MKVGAAITTAMEEQRHRDEHMVLGLDTFCRRQLWATRLARGQCRCNYCGNSYRVRLP